MDRLAAGTLDAWLQASGRRPLVLRGARQVGKTWLVRDLAERAKYKLIELNFERFDDSEAPDAKARQHGEASSTGVAWALHKR